MPRTTFGSGKGLADDSLRSTAENQHRWEQERSFRFPFIIVAKDGDNTEGSLRWQDPYVTEWIEKARNDLTAEDYRRFCFKDCALYMVSSRSTINRFRDELFDKIYRHWYPTRAEDVDISHGAFFCQLVEFQRIEDASDPMNLHQVVAFHKDLCSRLERFIPDLPPPTPRHNGIEKVREDHALLLPSVQYEVRPSFRRCFMHICAGPEDHSLDSQGMKERGVRVVFLHAEDAAKQGCTEDLQPGVKRLNDEEQGLGGAAVFQCDSIMTAMRIVLSADPQRVQDRQEWHGYYNHSLPEALPSERHI